MSEFIDKMKNKAQAAGGDDRARMRDLEQRRKEGKLDEEGRAELQRLRERFQQNRQ